MPNEAILMDWTSLPASVPGARRDVQLVHAGQVWIRHQPLGSLSLDYQGSSPVLLVALDVERVAEAPSGCRRGSFALLSPDHPAQIDIGVPLEVLAFRFDEPGILDRIGLKPEAILRGLDLTVLTLGREIRRVLQDEGEKGLAFVESLANAMLVRVGQLLSENRSATAVRQAVSPFNVRRIADHVRSHLADPIRVEDLASIAGLSRAHFSRAFASTVGETPHRFILGERLAFVRRTLEAEGGDLSHVAVIAGFSSHAHMTAAFRQAYGMTPSEYRDQVSRDEKAYPGFA